MGAPHCEVWDLEDVGPPHASSKDLSDSCTTGVISSYHEAAAVVEPKTVGIIAAGVDEDCFIVTSPHYVHSSQNGYGYTLCGGTTVVSRTSMRIPRKHYQGGPLPNAGVPTTKPG